MAETPHFLKDLEVREMQSLDHMKLAGSILQGIKLSAPPFRIALFGSWGSGKSTVLKLLQTEIDRESEESDSVFYRTFWFNAWEYESSANLFYSLLMLLVQEVPDGTRFSRKGSAVIQRAMQAARIHGRRWTTPQEEDSRQCDLRLAPADQDESHLVESIRADIDRLAEMMLVAGGKTRQKKMVVFIDDLDKCLPLHGLALLESVKLFFSSRAPIVFVFAIDEDVLGQAVHSKYGYRDIDFADSYIEKIFEFSFQVPHVNTAQVSNLVDEIFERSGLSQRPQVPERIQMEKDVFREVFNRPGLTLNPRRIKRIINRFIWFICQDPPLYPARELDAGELSAWLSWLLATEHWPELRDYVSTYGITAFKELGNRVTGHPLFPHSSEAAKQSLGAFSDLRAMLDYFRSLIPVPDEPHLVESQEEMRRGVMRLFEMDGVLRVHGI